MFARTRNFLCTILAPMVQEPFRRPGALALIMKSNRFACNVPEDNTIKVIHDVEGSKFHIEMPNHDCAFLTYEKEGNLVKILHTKVPEALEGRGIGKILAKAALQHVEQHNYRAETYCDYVRYYIEKYEPKYLKYLDN